jgi:hypothetical protein
VAGIIMKVWLGAEQKVNTLSQGWCILSTGTCMQDGVVLALAWQWTEK